MGEIRDYYAPETVEEALAILAERGEEVWIVAGGTDVMVRVRRGVVPAGRTALLGLSRLSSLRGVTREDGEVVIGPATTATDLRTDPLVAEHAPILAFAADRLASAQIRNVATVGGNLANASPAGDLINPLILLGARVALRSADEVRTVAVEEFFTGPGESVLRPDELLASVRVPIPPPGRVHRFRKAGTRPAMECSVITVGVAFTPDGEILRDVRVAYGSAAPTPLRGRAAERVLEGATPTPETIDRAAQAARGEVSPISDVRGSADYRRHLVGEYLRRLIDGRD